MYSETEISEDSLLKEKVLSGLDFKVECKKYVVLDSEVTCNGTYYCIGIPSQFNATWKFPFLIMLAMGQYSITFSIKHSF